MKTIIPLLIIILLIPFTLSDITITPIFPTSDITTSNSSIIITQNISTDYMKNLNFSWDGTNYSLYDSSLVLFYNFDNRSSLGENDTYVADLSMYSNNGTVRGWGQISRNISWNDNIGKSNGAFQFNGITDSTNKGYIYHDNLNNTIDYTKNFTVCYWAKPHRIYSTSINPVVSEEMDNTDNFFALGFINESNVGKVRIWYNNGSNVYLGQTFTASQDFTLNYNFYCFNFNMNTNQTLFYLNGLLNQTISLNNPKPQGTTHRFNIGSRGTTNYFYNGTIDDVTLWNVSLSNDKISLLYNFQLIKYNSTDWTLIANKTLDKTLSNSTHNYVYNFTLCINNITGANCSAQYQITSIPQKSSLITNFTSSIGNIREDFYGAETGGSSSFLNNTEYQIVWSNAGLKLDRVDAMLHYIYSNSSDGSVNFTQWAFNITPVIDSLKWKHNNGVKTIIISDYMPSWLADNSSGMCNDLKFCPASNYTQWNNILLDYINRVTEGNTSIQNDLIIEVWNEPEQSFFMGGLTDDDITKAYNYSILYNNTYNTIKGTYPNIPVGGVAVGFFWQPNMINTYLSNYSDQMDYVSVHSYLGANTQYGTSYDVYITNITNLVLSKCTTYNANCSRIIYSEWNNADNAIKNTSSQRNNYSQSIASAYYSMLNYPENISSIIYHFVGGTYTSGDLWWMYTKDGSTSPVGQYSASYNVTKSFAHLCPAGGTVYTSTSDDSNIKIVSCKKANDYGIIVINTGTESKNVTLDSNGLFKKLTDYETGAVYSTDDTFELGILDSYGIKYLTWERTSYVENYECGFADRMMIQLIIIAGSILLLSCFFMVMWKNGELDFDSITPEKFIGLFIAVMIGLSLIKESADIAGLVCIP